MRTTILRWNEEGKSNMALALLRDYCEPQWWIGREAKREGAIFELNRIISHAGALVSWGTGELHAAEADAVRDERLALKTIALSRSDAQRFVPESVPDVPLPARDKIPWTADEDAFREAFIVPLMRARRMRGVRIHHGPREYGKDIVGWYHTPFGYRRDVAVQVKMSLPGAASKGAIHEIQQQIQEAFTMKIPDAAGRTSHLTCEVWVVVACKLTAKVRDLIVDGLEDPARKANVRFFDRDDLQELFDEALRVAAATGARG